MPVRRKLTDEQIEDLCAKRERGWSYGRLGTHFGVSASAVHYQCLKNGAVSPHQRRGITPAEPFSFVAGDGRIQRRFTQADDAELLRLEAEGLRYGEISRRTGRAITSIRIRLMTLALREDLPG